MKRIISLTLAMFLAFTFCAAVADENLKVVDKTLIVYDNDDNGYFFAKIENKSDTDVYVDYGSNLVVFDDSDEILLTEEYVSSLPNSVRLAPGEYAYCNKYLWESALENATVSDFKFSPSSDTNGYDYSHLESECTLDYPGDDSYDNYVNVTFTNTTDEVLYNYYVVGAIYDQNQQLIFADSTYSNTMGIHPGSTITAKIYISKDLVDYYTAHDITPTTVDSIVYVLDDK